MISVQITEFNAYLNDVRRTYASVNLMSDEFGSISFGWTQQVVSNYWTRQFTLNMVNRLTRLQAEVRGIRPENPELRRIHTEYEAGLETFQEAFGLFLTQIDFSTADAIDQVNLLLFQGNRRLDQFRLMLSNLIGSTVVF